MKYFTRGWDDSPTNSQNVIQEYIKYYKSIEEQISINVKNALQNKHDVHILKAYYKEKIILWN